jgi:inner membrane protein
MPAHAPSGESRLAAWAAVVMVAALAPDLDFLWGRHRMETHSIGAALLAGLFTLLVTRRRDDRLTLAVTLAWASHVLFDWLGTDTAAPVGLMALWPFSGAFHFADSPLFLAVKRDGALRDIVVANLIAVAREVAILGPPAAALWWWRTRRS